MVPICWREGLSRLYDSVIFDGSDRYWPLEEGTKTNYNPTGRHFRIPKPPNNCDSGVSPSRRTACPLHWMSLTRSQPQHFFTLRARRIRARHPQDGMRRLTSRPNGGTVSVIAVTMAIECAPTSIPMALACRYLASFTA